MLDTALVRVTAGRLRDSLQEALPFIKSKACRNQIRLYIDNGAIPYLDLKRISAALSRDKRTEHLLVANLDKTLRQTSLIFPQRDKVDDPREREYRRMLWQRPRNDDDNSQIRTVTPVLNILISLLGASAGVFIFLKRLLGLSLERSVVGAVLAGFAFAVFEVLWVVSLA